MMRFEVSVYKELRNISFSFFFFEDQEQFTEYIYIYMLTNIIISKYIYLSTSVYAFVLMWKRA
jgi:hypothetical protein